ncbi:hypothetical protein WA1_40105 [Scytonema hofmannii PCC 7110]|uniref:Uncharacterized protein n=1 Tax=Scytonema hofmannii PCC 7110 TaxID=128403 RepID=A0A139WYY0_9CYAN|nr:hypothetical protein [Scytonema hofmannii]KYC37667.1 hypothetical protein WA1_40105 [Scytonema hofmannii PCC 7110]
MVENSEITKIQEKKTDVDSSKDELKKIPLLPRSAWNRQLSYLKEIFKAKQALDKREQIDRNSRDLK